jgi:hypothetical protein
LAVSSFRNISVVGTSARAHTANLVFAAIFARTTSTDGLIVKISQVFRVSTVCIMCDSCKRRSVETVVQLLVGQTSRRGDLHAHVQAARTPAQRTRQKIEAVDLVNLQQGATTEGTCPHQHISIRLNSSHPTRKIRHRASGFYVDSQALKWLLYMAATLWANCA